jgi:hypothetical protein
MSGAWDRVEGFQALAEWFGGTPGFHDGYMLALKFDFPAEAIFTVHAWRMTDRVNESGHFETERDFVATIRMSSLSEVHFETDYDGPGIVGSLAVFEHDDQLELRIHSVLGAGGYIRAKLASVSFDPGKPAA